MGRDDIALLTDMLAEVRYIAEATAHADVEEFLEDVTLRKAVERSLEILGEAAKAVSADARARHPALPWPEMARMRDFLIHAYHRVEPMSVWKTATEHAVPLQEAVETALARETSRTSA